MVNREKRFQSMEQVIDAIERPSLRSKIIMAAYTALAGALLFFVGTLMQRFMHIF
jgi:hypothetical protein